MVTRRAISMLLPAVLALGLACGGGTTDQGGAPPAPEPGASVPRIQRAIQPPAGEVSTASLPRVQIGSETRLVLSAQPRVVLQWREDVPSLGERLTIESELPPELADARRVQVDSWASVREQETEGKGLLELRALETGRRTLRRPPLVLDTQEGGARLTRARVDLEVPESMRGFAALVNAVARPLGDEPVQRDTTGPFEVAAGSQLRFGYGVEESGWYEGWPPVRFEVTVEAGDDAFRVFDRRIDPAGDVRDRRWFDAAIDLSRFAGQEVRIRFDATAMPTDESVADRSFPVVSNPTVLTLEGPIAPHRNVVLISLDTLRARSVSAYGYQRDTMPSLDARLADAGARVKAFVTPVPYTPPSHMTMLTGLEPCVHGVEDRHGVLSPSRFTLAEALRAGGFRTHAVTENGYVVAGSGFARGFDTYFEQLSEESSAPGFAAETFAAAERWLIEQPGQPFFLFVHTYQVHEPYTPPGGYGEQYAGDGASDHYAEKNRVRLDDYDREIRYTDDILASFLDLLDARGLADDTIVVVTSDHGEQFAEHFWVGHGLDVHDEAILVPFVVRAPGLVKPGVVIEEQAGLVDVVPTLLDLAGVSLPAPVQGRSFAGRLTGADASFRETPLYSRASHSESLRTSRYKYHHGLGKKAWEKLYRVDVDPDEKRNVAEAEPELLAEARAALADHADACEQWERDHPAESAAAEPGGRQPGWLINRDEIDEKLRSLGYIE